MPGFSRTKPKTLAKLALLRKAHQIFAGEPVRSGRLGTPTDTPLECLIEIRSRCGGRSLPLGTMYSETGS